MMQELKASANAEAQRAMKALVAWMVKHPGRRNALLEDTYRASERVVDAVEEYESYLNAATQAADDEAPDYFALITESELRGQWGDR